MPLQDEVSLKTTINLLNEAFALDPEGMQRLIEARVPVNMELRDHPTIQVWSGEGGTEPPTLGFLGLINGLFGVDDINYGAIEAYYVKRGPEGREKLVLAGFRSRK